MRLLIKTTLIVMLSLNFSYSQLKNSIKSNKIPVNSKGLSHAQVASFLNPNRFSMNQNFGMSMTSFNGQSISFGTYSNQLEYFIKDNMRLTTNIGISYPLSGSSPLVQNNFISPNIYYGANLDYKVSENMFFNFSINQYGGLFNYAKGFNVASEFQFLF